ncbi:MAG: serpin family protein [Candidatus Dojkabacteria bacterium]|nr:MAG: serpin family protein [Candidatus Dojkabacteria bacterium]
MKTFLQKYGFIIIISISVVAILLIILYVIFWGESAEPVSDKQDPNSNQSDVKDLKPEVITQSSNQFGAELIAAICSSDQEACEENLFISPVSIHSALAMLGHGAAGDTKDQIWSVLNIENSADSVVAAQYKSLNASLNRSGESSEISIANSLWANSENRVNAPIKQSYLDQLTDNYGALVSSLPFSQASTLDEINGWASEKTKGKITKVVDELSGDTYLILMNAIYTKADWKYQFDPELTEEKDFTKANGGKVRVPMMSSGELDLNYFDGDEWSAVELPYADESLSSWLFMPKGDGSVADFNYELFESVLAGSVKGEASVELPKFTIRGDLILNDYLNLMGMEDAFGEGVADLSGISDAELYVSKVQHISYLQVDEEGSEAAAVTSVVVDVTSVGLDDEPFAFIADQPFVYTIYDKNNGVLLFVGLINDPSTVQGSITR